MLQFFPSFPRQIYKTKRNVFHLYAHARACNSQRAKVALGVSRESIESRAARYWVSRVWCARHGILAATREEHTHRGGNIILERPRVHISADVACVCVCVCISIIYYLRNDGESLYILSKRRRRRRWYALIMGQKRPRGFCSPRARYNAHTHTARPVRPLDVQRVCVCV